MKYRTLGRTGIEVSELALGGLFVSKAGGDFEQGRAAVHRAIELGVNYIDTAPTYSNSEEVLGHFLADIDKPLVLATKLGGRPDPFEPQNPDHLRRSLETSLELLGRDSVDLLMVHEPDRPGHFDWWTDMARVEGPVLECLEQFKKEGLVRYTGLGGTAVYEMAHLCRSGKFDVVLTAFNYSLLWREAQHHVVPAARSQDMGIIIGSPLQQGALAKQYPAVHDGSGYWLSPARREQFKQLYALADELDMPLPELALRFVVSDRDVSCVLMGARSAEEVEQNHAAIEKGPLPGDVLKRLDEIAAMVPFRPAEEPSQLGWRLANPTWYKGPGPMG